MPYSELFPYAQTTREIAGWLPPWMKAAKDPASNFQQFINAFGIELDEVREDIALLWNSVFINALPSDLVTWVKKASLPVVEPVHVEGYIDGEWIDLEPAERLRDFLKEDGHLYIIDYDRQVIYFRQMYEATRVNGELLDLEDHHVWNPFDEFALKARLTRHHLEDNDSLRRRTLLAFRYPHGVAAPLAAFAGLVRELVWSGPELVLTDNDVIPGTIRINDLPAYPGQVEGGILSPKIAPLLTKGQFSQTMLSHGKLVLVPGALRGEWTSELLAPGNLGRWLSLEYEAEGDVKVDLLPRMFLQAPEQDPIITGVPSGAAIEDLVDEGRRSLLEQGLYIRVRMKKGAALRSLVIHYEPQDKAQVTYLYGVTVEDLGDPKVKMRLKTKEPGKLEELIDELYHAMPLFWDQFIWNESFWDIYDENLVGLDVLDVPWGGSLEGIRHLNPGVGDGEDLLAFQENFKIMALPGHFFQGDGLKEHYLFGNPKTFRIDQPVDYVLIEPGAGEESIEYLFDYAPIAPEFPSQVAYALVKTQAHWLGPPVVVQGFQNDHDATYLKQVAFLSEDLELRITNGEVVIGTGEPHLVVTYSGLDPEKIWVEGHEVDIDRYDGSDRIFLKEPVPEGAAVPVRYGLKDSYILSADGGRIKIQPLRRYDRLEITIEGGGRRDLGLDLDPAKTHLTSGFVYIAGKNHPPAEVRLRATPAALIADGKSRAIVVVDVLDRFGNPVYHVSPTVTIDGVGESGATLSNPGAIQFVASDRGRYSYQYTAPAINENATVSIQAKAGEASDTQTIQLKEAVE